MPSVFERSMRTFILCGRLNTSGFVSMVSMIFKFSFVTSC
jgi:hypothetical protein